MGEQKDLEKEIEMFLESSKSTFLGVLRKIKDKKARFHVQLNVCRYKKGEIYFLGMIKSYPSTENGPLGGHLSFHDPNLHRKHMTDKRAGLPYDPNKLTNAHPLRHYSPAEVFSAFEKRLDVIKSELEEASKKEVVFGYDRKIEIATSPYIGDRSK